MASLKNLIAPDAQELYKDAEERANAEQTRPSGPDTIDVIRSSYSNAYMHTLGVGAIAPAIDYVANGFDAPRYTEEQLAEIYPDIPSEVFKGGARAYQAEFLAHKFKIAEEARQVEKFVQSVSNPNSSMLGNATIATSSFISSLAAGLADPASIPISIVGGTLLNGVSKATLPIFNKLAPGAYKYLLSTVGSSRFLSNIVPEVASNLATDMAISYPVQNKLLSQYTKDEITLGETFVQSLGSAMVFGVGRGIFKGKNVEFGLGAHRIIQDSVDRSVKTNGDLVSVKVGSETHGEVVLQTAAADSMLNPQIRERSVRHGLAETAFSNTSTNEPPTGLFALVEKGSGSTDYLGNRHGDNLVFIDSQNAVQGMADVYSSTGPKEFDVYSLNPDKYNILDIEHESIDNHPEILDILEERFGKSAVDVLPENATVGDVYKKVNNSTRAENASADDIVSFFERTNKILEEKGYDGIAHTNDIADPHRVVEIFQNKASGEDMSLIARMEGKTGETPIDPSFNPRNDDITLSDGQTIKATEEVPFDPVYHEDFDHMSILEKEKQQAIALVAEQPKNLDTVNVEEVKTMAEEIMNLLPDENAKKELQDAIDRFANDPPEKQPEIVKAIENCLRKYT